MYQKIKDVIQSRIPYRFLNIFLFIIFMLSLVFFIIGIIFSFIQVKPVLYDIDAVIERKYMYLDIDRIESVGNHYYLVESDCFTYIYYNEDLIDISNVKRIEGVPLSIDDKDLEVILPYFQKRYPHLYIETIDDITDYTGSFYFNANEPPLASKSHISFLIGGLFFIVFVFELCLYYYRNYTYGLSIKKLISNQNDIAFLQQFNQPIKTYSRLKAILLKEYLVVNNPVPYIISYQDILWIYVEKRIFLPQLRLVIYNQSHKRVKVMCVFDFMKTNKDQMKQFLEDIHNIYPNILIGYNQNNKEEMKSLK